MIPLAVRSIPIFKTNDLMRIAKFYIKPLMFFMFLLLGGNIGCSIVKSTGKNPSGEKLSSIRQLPNYRHGRFQNLDTVGESSKRNYWKIIKEKLNTPEYTRPSFLLPSVQTDLCSAVGSKPTVIWFGHSSFLIKWQGVNILVDPEFSGHAGPFSGLLKAFPGSNNYSVDDMPVIDILVISHDHYDHLDYETILKLKSRVKQVVVPIGVGSHFVYWGYDPKIVHELNWYECLQVSTGIKLIAAPAKHESRRTFTSCKTLWASWIFEIGGYKIYYSGDTGYGSHFRTIGKLYGPFDLALMECGQYNKNWKYHHMFPYQTAQATADLQAKIIIPVHWAKFTESNHPWNEPVKLLLPTADSLKIKVCVPEIGEPYTLGEPVKKKKWWLR